MAIYADDRGRLFLLTFRSSKHISEERVGGLLAIRESKIRRFEKSIRFSTVIGFGSLTVMMIYLVVGWPSSDYAKSALGLAAFFPFTILVLNILRFTSAPNLVVVKGVSLALVNEQCSMDFHLASALSSLSITTLFATIGISVGVHRDEDLVLLLLVILFWALYSVLSVRNFLRIKRS